MCRKACILSHWTVPKLLAAKPTTALFHGDVALHAATFLTRPSNDKLGFSKKGHSPLDLPPGLIRTVVSSREPPRAQISIK